MGDDTKVPEIIHISLNNYSCVMYKEMKIGCDK
jgi:hypothetical protein